MSAHAISAERLFAQHANPALVADALTRIPCAHFRGMGWARQMIATCAELLADAASGDRRGLVAWAETTGAAGDSEALVAVFAAVCDALVANVFRSHGDVADVAAFIAAVERDVLGHVAVERRRRDCAALSDPQSALLAEGLVRIAALHDPLTAAHLEAAAVLARRIALVMHLPAAQVNTIELAARLHDIGKIGVDTRLLHRVEPLDEHSWAVLQRHAERGAAVLRETPQLAGLAPIVRAHHERIDGTGYPDQLRGNDIPLEARVVAVADAFHAMTSERAYRRALLPNDALTLLARHSGTQFDPDVVEAAFALFRFTRRARRRQIA